MRKFSQLFFVLTICSATIIACSSGKKVGGVSLQKGDFSGDWTITDIHADIPAGIRVSTVFDMAPYSDFQESTWTLERNGNGYFKLKNGSRQDIYWSFFKQDTIPQFQFKKINEGDKARNIDNGYRLQIMDKLNNSFILQMPVPVNNATDGHLRFTFTKLKKD